MEHTIADVFCNTVGYSAVELDRLRYLEHGNSGRMDINVFT